LQAPESLFIVGLLPDERPSSVRTDARLQGTLIPFFTFCLWGALRRMRDTRPVELVVNLPEGLAEEVEEVRQTDPEFLSDVIVYGICRRTIFNELLKTRREGAAAPTTW